MIHKMRTTLGADGFARDQFKVGGWKQKLPSRIQVQTRRLKTFREESFKTH